MCASTESDGLTTKDRRNTDPAESTEIHNMMMKNDDNTIQYMCGSHESDGPTSVIGSKTNPQETTKNNTIGR